MHSSCVYDHHHHKLTLNGDSKPLVGTYCLVPCFFPPSFCSSQQCLILAAVECSGIERQCEGALHLLMARRQ